MIIKGKQCEYEVLSPLSKNGRFSNTFLGIDQSNGRKVILKQLHPRHTTSAVEIRRFVREGSLQPDLAHTIVPSELITANNDAWQVRPYFKGEDLRIALPSLKTEQKLEIFRKVVEAVKELHECGILHLDLKPSNILLSTDRVEVKLIDLGLAYPIIPEQKKPGFNRSFWKLAGTVYPFSFYYSAPEQMLNFNDMFCEATDAYSLGIILYEMLSGEKPFEGTHPAILTNMMLNAELPLEKITNSEYREVIAKATHKYKFPGPPHLLSKAQQRQGLKKGIEGRIAYFYTL